MKSLLLRPLSGILWLGLAGSLHAQIADSVTDWAATNEQGFEGWTYGYYNQTQDLDYDPGQPLGDSYSTSKFEAFVDDSAPWIWDGAKWDWLDGNPPWTEVGQENTHPNGDNNGDVHWTIRRWVADEIAVDTSVVISWAVGKTNPNCGNGVTGLLFHNGELIDFAVIAASNAVGEERLVNRTLEPGDVIDLALSPRGADNLDGDGCDGSFFRMSIAAEEDSDNDNLPDPWELRYFPGDLTQLSGLGGADFDSDMLTDLGELERGTDPREPDTDGDGLTDVVETGTGTFVSPDDTGSTATNPDTDGDTLGDGAEVAASPATDPNKADTDDDDARDDRELVLGTDPTDPASAPLADSITQFSGVQGQGGWSYGYRELLEGDPDDYDPDADFIPFEGGAGMGPWDGFAQHWTGGDSTTNGSWDLETAAAGPWTVIGQESGHPNGTNSAPNLEQWAIRRWTNDTPGTLDLVAIWNVREANLAGNGVSGHLSVNGMLVDKVVVAGGDGVGEVRNTFFSLAPGQSVDLALTPEGPGNDRGDGSDGSLFWMGLVETEDSDGDDLPDYWEYQWFPGDLTKLSGAGDFDSDQLTDGDELTRTTNPTLADTDADGLNDNVETNTGTFVDADDTGTDPNNPDTDGEGLTDGAEVNGAVTSDPHLVDTDDDFFDDAIEVGGGWDPRDPNDNPDATRLADSTLDFSTEQGFLGWQYGYRNYTQDGGGEDYDPDTGFIPFLDSELRGAGWGLAPSNAPWTLIGPDGNGHPNGTNSAPNEEHWAIRRWVADVPCTTPLQIVWFLRGNGTGGVASGTGGSLHQNGVQLDKVVVPGNDTAGVTRSVFINAGPGDVIDLALTPENPDGSRADGSDGSFFGFSIQSRLPGDPMNPVAPDFVDYEPFAPASGICSFEIVSVSYDSLLPSVTITWNSNTSSTYSVFYSDDLATWLELDDGIPGQADFTSFEDETLTSDVERRYYRVQETRN